MTCQTLSDIEYCQREGTWSVGSGSQTNGAWKGSHTLINLVIPKSIGNIQRISYISKYAFNCQINMRTVEIYADIIVIEHMAFSNNPKLERINIPSTTTTLGPYSIQCYNSTKAGAGTLTVIFDINSHIQTLNTQSIAMKEQINIYICGVSKPSYPDDVFEGSNIKVFSPKSFKFCGVSTLPLSVSSFSFTCSSTTNCPAISVYLRYKIGLIMCCFTIVK